MPPALAKILALLLINDEPEMTFDQIRETLSLSKSATSQALNQLLTLEKIEYKTKIGDRKRYFCSRVMRWQEDTKSQMEGLDFFASLLKQILEQRPSKTKEFNASLKKLISFMDYLAKEMPILYKKFEDKA
ncbi:MAG: MarR family transcriptional regulator, partial [Bacteroidota bacterium]|nr:MarR family transcriptional regulator [Bacteroidota bacterium]